MTVNGRLTLSKDGEDIAADMERRAKLPKIARADSRSFLENLDKIIKGDVVVSEGLPK